MKRCWNGKVSGITRTCWPGRFGSSRRIRVCGPAYQGRFRHLLVDEYQDLNEAQYLFFRALAGPEAEIMVIGDPHQAIYGFRGARPEYFCPVRGGLARGANPALY